MQCAASAAALSAGAAASLVESVSPHLDSVGEESRKPPWTGTLYFRDHHLPASGGFRIDTSPPFPVVPFGSKDAQIQRPHGGKQCIYSLHLGRQWIAVMRHCFFLKISKIPFPVFWIASVAPLAASPSPFTTSPTTVPSCLNTVFMTNVVTLVDSVMFL